MIKIIIIEEELNDKGQIMSIYRGELVFTEEQNPKEIIDKYNNFFSSDPYFKNYKCLLMKEVSQS